MSTTAVKHLLVLALGMLLLNAAPAAALTTASPTIKTRPILFFSTEESFVANRGPWAGQTISPGDLLTSWGQVIPNAVLTRHFSPMPPRADYGLDAVFMLNNSQILFSTETTFFDERLGTNISHGDLLSDRGAIVQSNSELLRNFNPPPSFAYQDYGLDALQRSPATSAANTGVLFSTEDSFYDTKLQRLVGHGDLLSTTGQVVMSNAQLLKNFHPLSITMQPMPADYGLDGFQRLSNTELWFTTERGFYDEQLGRYVSEGDLLSTRGRIVMTNQQLLSPFLRPTMTNVPIDYGLDAFWMAYPPPSLTADQITDFVLGSLLDELDPDSLPGTVPEPASLFLLILPAFFHRRSPRA